MTRKEAVIALVAFDRPLDEIENALSSSGWDWDKSALASLSLSQVQSVLKRYERGQLDRADIVEWANLIEAREDIAVDEDAAEAIFDLANPVLQGPIEQTMAAILAKI